MTKTAEIMLVDGTTVLEGDKVLAQGESGSWRVAKVLEIFTTGGIAKAILTAPLPFGTVIRSRYQIKALRKPKKGQ